MSIPQPSPFQAQRDKRQHIYISDFLELGDFSPHSSLELPYIRQQDAAWLAKLLAPENMHLESYRNWIPLVFGLIFQLSSLKEEEAKKKKKEKKNKTNKWRKQRLTAINADWAGHIYFIAPILALLMSAYFWVSQATALKVFHSFFFFPP